jgi:ribosome-associated toxin RatA of RatAB toxin-antitoxin module
MKYSVATTLRAFASLLVLVCSVPCLGADWALTGPQLQRLDAGAIIAEGEVATDKAMADIRAAVRVNATPEQVFRTLTDCAQALRFVPHLKRCAVLDTAPDGSWQNVEHLVDYGWLAPRARYVFHADYQRFERIRFSNVTGDFRENHGVWVFRPLNDGRATLVTYEAQVAPAFYVPRWMMRNMLKRDLPELMRGLRARSEATQPTPVTGGAPPIP